MKSSLRLASRSAFNASARQSLSATRRPQHLKPPANLISRPLAANPLYQHSFRRAATEAAPSSPRRRRGGFFRWTWRFIYLSALAGTGFVAYEIYLLRTPNEQFEPDPSKKTLVILGMSNSSVCLMSGNPCSRRCYRNWLGLRLSAQETRHGKLQRHRYLPSQLLPLHSASPFLHHRSHRAPIHHGARPQYSQA